MSVDPALPGEGISSQRDFRMPSTARRYFEIVRFRVFADLKSEAAKTYLGILWWVLEPLLFLAILYFVFAHLRSGSREGFAAFLFVGLVIWQWIRSAILHAGDGIRNNLHLLRQVRLPPSIFPVIVVATDTVKFGVVLSLLLIALPLMGYQPGLKALWLLVLLLVCLIFITGAGLLASSIIPILPDLRLALETVMTALMFVSGVFFSVDSVPDRYRWVMDVNPVAVIISNARTALLENNVPDLGGMVYVATCGLVLGIVGITLIVRLAPKYTKMVV